jgi:hypothetical protein
VSWFKLDDGFYDHPKVADLPDSAIALWTRSASYCMKHLTDGAVPERTARRLVDNYDEALAALLKSGLWEQADAGYAFHDWLKYQPSREKVLAERESEAERQRLRREKNRSVPSDVHQYVRRDTGRTSARTSDVSTPGRTDTPTRPHPTPISQNQNPVVDLSSSLTKQDPSEVETEEPERPPKWRNVFCPEHGGGMVTNCEMCLTDHRDRAYWTKRPWTDEVKASAKAAEEHAARWSR